MTVKELPRTPEEIAAVEDFYDEYRGATIRSFIDEDDGSVWYSVYCGDTSFHLRSLEEARKEIDEELDRLGLDYAGQDE
jgi:hypothetical protein